MIKKYTIAVLLSLLIPAVLFSSSGKTPRWKNSQEAELAGKLGYTAMATDAYYEICHYKGVRTDNHLRGIDKLMKKKWGMSFSKMSLKMEERSGRDIREEAHTMIHHMIKKYNGCNTRGMKKWFKIFSKMHGKNLDKFHALK
jgi:hypothetical protein